MSSSEKQISSPSNLGWSCEDRWALGLIFGLLVLRVLWLWLTPLDLVPDESYYWDWGRHPAWCYFSKPPMIGWINTCTQWLGWTTAPTMRLPAAVLSTLGMVPIWLLARRMRGARWALAALLLAASMPGSVALGSILTIDVPLIACWSFCLLALWRLVAEGGEKESSGCSVGWWLAYWLVGSLGVLSKQMMLVMPLLAGVFLWTRPGRFSVMRRSVMTLALWVPVLALIPVLLWNQRHGWITLEHTAHHFDAPKWTLARCLEFFGGAVGGQLGLAGPVLFVLVIAVALKWREAWQDRRQWFLWLFSVPPLAGILLLSLHQEINVNWPATFYLAGGLLVIGWAANGPTWREKWLRRAWWSGGSLVALLYSLVLLIAPLGLKGSKLDFTARLAGWSKLGTEIGAVKAKVEAESGQPLPVIVADVSRKYASSLAFYLPEQPKVWLWLSSGMINSQYALWPGPFEEITSGDALLVIGSGATPANELQAHFASVEFVDTVDIHIGGKRHIKLDVWRGRGIHPVDKK